MNESVVKQVDVFVRQCADTDVLVISRHDSDGTAYEGEIMWHKRELNAAPSITNTLPTNFFVSGGIEYGYSFPKSDKSRPTNKSALIRDWAEKYSPQLSVAAVTGLYDILNEAGR